MKRTLFAFLTLASFSATARDAAKPEPRTLDALVEVTFEPVE